jgi:hypothetical protein
MDEKISLKLISALDAVWSKIRTLHPEVVPSRITFPIKRQSVSNFKTRS